MAKYYDLAKKIQAIELYKIGQSVLTIGRQLDVSASQVQRWYNLYERYGEEGLTNKNRVVKYEDKCKAVHKVLDKGLSCEHVALIYRYGRSSVAKWVSQVRETGCYETLKRKKHEQERKSTNGTGKIAGGSGIPTRGERTFKKNFKGVIGSRENAIDSLRKDHRLSVMLPIEGIPRSTYYYRLAHQKTERHAKEKSLILTIYEKSGRTYGYRRITLAMRAEGFSINHKTVRKLMNELGIQALQKRKKYNSYKGTVGNTADNLISRNFHADKPREKLTTDISQINIGETKLYLSAMVDMFNGEVVSYTISESPNMKLVMRMMHKADRNNAFGEDCIVHSDQGWQYQHFLYNSFLKSRNIVQSMSRKGNCYDNAIMESFFGSMKSELLYLNKFNDKDDFIGALDRYINYYNKERIKLRLGTSPVIFKNQFFF